MHAAQDDNPLLGVKVAQKTVNLLDLVRVQEERDLYTYNNCIIRIFKPNCLVRFKTMLLSVVTGVKL